MDGVLARHHGARGALPRQAGGLLELLGVVLPVAGGLTPRVDRIYISIYIYTYIYITYIYIYEHIYLAYIYIYIILYMYMYSIHITVSCEEILSLALVHK